MRVFAKIFLIVFFVPLLLTLLLLISVRFQILSPDFWINAYEKNGTYQKLETAIPKIIEYQTIKEGGTKQELAEAKEIASLLTKGNLKITIEKNIKNTLDYINGKSDFWIIFIPKDKLPKGLLPNFLLDSDEIPVETLVSFFSRGRGEIRPATVLPSWIPLIGKIARVALLFLIILAIFIGFLLYRLKVLSIAFIISGVTVLILGGIAALFRKVVETEWAKEGEPSQLLLGTMGLPIAAEIINLWLIIAAFAVATGILLASLAKRRVQ